MKIGQIENTGTVGHRDSFHVPAVLVTASGIVKPGDFVRFVDDSYEQVGLACGDPPHAVYRGHVLGSLNAQS